MFAQLGMVALVYGCAVAEAAVPASLFLPHFGYLAFLCAIMWFPGGSGVLWAALIGVCCDALQPNLLGGHVVALVATAFVIGPWHHTTQRPALQTGAVMFVSVLIPAVFVNVAVDVTALGRIRDGAVLTGVGAAMSTAVWSMLGWLVVAGWRARATASRYV